MRLFQGGLLAALLFVLAVAAVPCAAAAERPRFAYAVVCNDPALAEALRAGIEARFSAAHVDIADKLANAKLFVYANRDANDRKNPEGVSIAIAHVSNAPTAMLALPYVKRNEAMPDMLRSMLSEEGFLQHLNVAHMDTPNDAQLKEILDKLVANFLNKYGVSQ